MIYTKISRENIVRMRKFVTQLYSTGHGTREVAKTLLFD